VDQAADANKAGTHGHHALERARVRAAVPVQALEAIELPEVEEEEHAELRGTASAIPQGAVAGKRTRVDMMDQTRYVAGEVCDIVGGEGGATKRRRRRRRTRAQEMKRKGTKARATKAGNES
jgi:hypothetical protein